MLLLKAPANLNIIDPTDKTIFLASSIEMGAAEDWQEEVVQYFSDVNVVLLNPRRDNWDPSWEQSISNPQFYEQVTWELNAMDLADKILINFLPNTKSPISLLELGIYAHTDKVVVCCPEGFWRKGNVDIVCERFNIPVFDQLEQALQNL